ncbi:MAG: P-II family nitrogen regulator [Nitrososphaeraceae archaeon]|nr:P-II family nitrogen regulator [Nitrososphaeraceae archaeon]MBV9667204.1 P-II family nitrogen regulator [Nitrososphaeraceae archaeon]
MKRIEAIIPHSGLPHISGALKEMGLHFTHYDTRGLGKTPAISVEFDRGTSTMIEEFNTNVTVMTIVNDSMVDSVIEQILNYSYNTEGKIFVSGVDDAIDIKTKRRGDSAL